MAQRYALPTRLQLQTLSGLQQAVVGGANSVASDVVTLATVQGFINAAEDDFFQPLRLIWMRITDVGISLNQYGWFDLRTALSQTCIELVSVYSRGGITGINNSNYWQYEIPYDRKDLSTFRKLQGNVNVEPIYTVDGSIVKVWPPANYYGPIVCSYYADWARLGDISSGSTLQTYKITLNGVATTAGSVTFTTAGNVFNLPVLVGDTGATLIVKLSTLNVTYSKDTGGNILAWQQLNLDANNVQFTAPSYVASDVVFSVATTGASGITASSIETQAASMTTITNNWFLDNFPYAYFYGALKHVCLYLNDVDRAKYFHDQTMKQISSMQAYSDRADISDPSDGFNWNQQIQW